ncbi:UNVERIFIED_CONTAM: LRR receptor kinase SERK2 [Sesamum calycinum]|uniref:LRR receptor kinase SERK2 n=1 Tax=Sesamum calycinum TaxID=2727403 RepID=A0AAW2N2H8_9LAMI
MEDERKRKRQTSEQENETEKRKAVAASVINDGLPDTLGAVPEFDPDKEVAYTDLQLFTDNFSEEKRIGRTQFGILYGGKIPQGWRGNDEKDVTVKLWVTESRLPGGGPYHIDPEYLLDRMKDEIRFTSLPFLTHHQIVGERSYCFEVNRLGVVYDVKPLDTVARIMSDKDKFGWRNRVKVALGLARLLKLCHGNAPKYLVRNLSAAHVIVDKDFNPILVDFAMISTYSSGTPTAIGRWLERTDVYTFGVVLLELILKETSFRLMRLIKADHTVTLAEFVCGGYGEELDKALNGEMKHTLVHAYLQRDPDYDADDGTKLTMLALRCVLSLTCRRPTMQEVVEVEVAPQAGFESESESWFSDEFWFSNEYVKPPSAEGNQSKILAKLVVNSWNSD